MADLVCELNGHKLVPCNVRVDLQTGLKGVGKLTRREYYTGGKALGLIVRKRRRQVL
jgi:hypothetical protein